MTESERGTATRDLDVLCVGEALVDLVTARRGRLGDSPTFHRYPGGAPANVARALARLGARSAWSWAVGDDEFGRYLEEAIAADGVETSGAVRLPGRQTGLSFIALDESGERAFTGYGQPDAAMFYGPEHLDRAQIERAVVLHFGSNTLMAEAPRRATLEALSIARNAECHISLDLNVRAHLWDTVERAVAEVRQFLPGTDVLKASLEEAALVTGAADPLEAARRLHRWGAGLAVVTAGARGCVYSTEGAEGEVGAPPVRRVVDATGAGDSFCAGLLWALLPAWREEMVAAELGDAGLSAALEFASHLGALAVGVEGAVEWPPERAPSRPPWAGPRP